jgi:glycerol-3-phosphate dehydrogenase
MKIAIIGGGINGLFTSWVLSKEGHEVCLYEDKKTLSQTSSSSSKLIHGGIRYLEQGHFSLVMEAIKDRHWWLQNAPEFVKPIKLAIPIYKNSRRSTLIVFFGTLIYRLFARSYSLGPSEYIGSKKVFMACPDIKKSELKSAITFYDAQMNEEALGEWVKEESLKSGVKIFENTKITKFNSCGTIYLSNETKDFDLIINAAGPWAHELNLINNIKTNYSLNLIKGSHILVDRKVSNFYLLQDIKSQRIVFVLPYLGSTIIGTTEVPQKDTSNIKCSDEEVSYLIDIFNTYFDKKVCKSNIIKKYSGLRPLVMKNNNKLNFTSASRESVIETNEKILTIYGGKWTSAPSLSKKVLRTINKNYA